MGRTPAEIKKDIEEVPYEVSIDGKKSMLRLMVKNINLKKLAQWYCKK